MGRAASELLRSPLVGCNLMNTLIRGLFAVSLALCLFACSNDSPTTPSTPTPSSPRIIAVSGILAFGGVEVGTVRDLSFSIGNAGTAPLTVTGITVPAQYTPSWTSGQIPAGGSQNVTLRFEPWAPMPYDGTLTISADHTSGTSTLSVSGSEAGRSAPAFLRSKLI